MYTDNVQTKKLQLCTLKINDSCICLNYTIMYTERTIFKICPHLCEHV